MVAFHCDPMTFQSHLVVLVDLYKESFGIGCSCGGGSGCRMAKTAIIFKCSRLRDGFSAKDVPITLRSAHSDPVGMLTSIFVPR
jgi:hypothetical protein